MMSCHAVLGRFLHSLNKFAHEEYGLEFDICDYEVYEFAKVEPWRAASCWCRCLACKRRRERAPQIWNCSKDESNRIVHQFFKSHHFAVGILPIPGALRCCCSLAAHGCACPPDRSPDPAERTRRRASQPAAPGSNVRPGGGDLAAALHPGTHAGVD